MRFVHVLAIDTLNSYWRMTQISAASVRAWHPDAELVLLADRGTEAILCDPAVKPDLETSFDRLLGIDAPGNTPAMRSRFLKSAMRGLIEGDFLFLDSDTVVCGDLSELSKRRADLCAVSDQNRDKLELPEVEHEVFAACDWKTPSSCNVNSGVLYWRDTDASRALGEQWHRKWHESLTATGRHNDQQALNSAIEDMRHDIKVEELPAAFNAQVGLRPDTAFGAKVWHIFSTNRHRVPHMRTVFDPIWDGKQSIEQAAPFFKSPHPFHVRDWFDAFIIESLRKRPAMLGNLPFNDWRRLWLAGDRQAGLKRLAETARRSAGRRVRSFVSILPRPQTP